MKRKERKKTFGIKREKTGKKIRESKHLGRKRKNRKNRIEKKGKEALGGKGRGKMKKIGKKRRERKRRVEKKRNNIEIEEKIRKRKHLVEKEEEKCRK
jgi:hypothetical protein